MHENSTRWRLTLKLLCTSVSSKSMTIHFLCISECLIWGNKYRFWPPLPVRPVAWPIVCVCSPSIDPFWIDFDRREEIDALRCLQQQKSVSHILRFCGFTFSSMLAVIKNIRLRKWRRIGFRNGSLSRFWDNNFLFG